MESGDQGAGVEREAGGWLARHPLFAGLGVEQRERLRQGMRVVTLEPGAVLFHQGQPATRFFLLLEGCVKLFRLSADGQEKVIELIQPGGVFAEAVMFMETPLYPVNADAVVASRVLAMDNQRYLALLRESPATALALLGEMSRWLHRLVNDIDRLTLQNASFRLAVYLLQLLPPDAEGSCTVALPVPKRVIASRLSVQPETFSRLLQSFSRDGWISVNDLEIRVHDVARLRRLVSLEEEL